MVPLADSRQNSPAEPRAPYAARALRSVGYGIAIGLCIALLRRQNIGYTLVYSACIALLCWFCIDVGRRVLAGRLYRRSSGTRDYWPGWRWMVFVVVIGSGLGFTGGTQLGDLLTGQHTPFLFTTGDLRQGLADLLFVVLPAVVITYVFYSRRVIADREAAAQAAR